MSSRFYPLVSGSIFGIVAIGHVLRAAFCLPLVIGGVDIPVWISWPGAVGALAMCAWALAAGRSAGSTR